MLARSAHVLLALVATNSIGVAIAQDCGQAWQRPCTGGLCREGSVYYGPANLCAACGDEAQFCCESEGQWTCKESSLACRILPNPYDNDADGTPLGQARICVGGAIAGTETPDASPSATKEAELTPEGQLVSAICPGEHQQCSGLSFEGVQNCCAEGLQCVFFNKWYSQCQKAPNAPSAPQTPAAEDNSCAKGYETCAGQDYGGKQNCCEEGYTCVFQNINKSQCRPDSEVTEEDITATPAPQPIPTPEPTKTDVEPTEPQTEPQTPVETPFQGPVAKTHVGDARRVSIDTGEMQWKDSKSPKLGAASEWKYELDTMLGMSYFFYELQRAGPLPATTRAPWRGDSLKSPSGGNLDGDRFQGGYFDAGDHNKFQLPTAYAVARLNWILHAFDKALRSTYFDGRWNRKWAREAAKWGADFMARSVEEDQVLLHIGDIKNDHNYLGRAEYYPDIDRNILFCPSGECSDVSGEIAASLAHAAIAFRTSRGVGNLATEYWNKAVMAYKQTGAATMSFGNSNDVFELLKIYYPSTDAEMYKAHALELAITKEADGGQKWFWELPGWDNAWWDGAMLMAQMGEEGPKLFGKPAFKEYLAVFSQKWTYGLSPIKVSPLGQRFVLEWGSNRFAASGAAIALMWADLPDEMREESKVTRQDARCMAVKQLHYVAGDNDRGSYIAGFGSNPPVRNHHRNSVCAPWEQKASSRGTCEELFVDVINPVNNCPSDAPADSKGQCYLTANRPNRFKTHGALIGGPKTPADAGDPDRRPYSLEGWNDWRTDWIGSEQTLDYNAHFTMALAAAIELPKSVWTSPCGGERTDLMLTSKAGLERVSMKYADDNVYTFADFEEHSFTRTLPDTWMSIVP